MDIDKLREDLIIDEGTKNEIYLDHLGLPTFGIGHLVTEWDEEYELPVGTAVCGYQLKNSRYYTQVTARADRLIARLQAI